MNKAIYTGNIVRDINLTYVQGSGVAVLKNTIAVRRKIKNKTTGKYNSDFIPFVAFGVQAEFIANNFEKGQGIQLETHTQSGSYTKDGVTHYTLEAVVDSVEFMGSKPNAYNQDYQGSNNFSDMNQDYEEDITPVDYSDSPF
ncbi:single-stranded DNA-binding protein [Clostridium botulinum]|uniref:single-stranded DNA-binding protein n=1 Tax=Clostridium botulinum TaxID=1491 RepID=UPI00059783B6|nr:single-stranded DNA-binding protein [Clostridium botulinum]KIL06878.1 single-stranded DNA-binding protein [Clostridium botulinum]MBY6935335.1 single-stranded DNA-binding protein [Clostridium botulinum]NFL84358.1 single-stranded DNA-binding protein [Clostridium botulinum]NFN13210.1 single-stranded DNA-binding protein [Clostridium botulinum]NFO38181.1 single-stranded DNA-binding protein [Clostridium botulinum]